MVESPSGFGAFWSQVDTLKATAATFKRLGWTDLRQAPTGWSVRKDGRQLTVRGSTLRALLGEVERREVARRAERIEKTATAQLCAQAGWLLERARRGKWMASKLGRSPRVLCASSAAELRAALRREVGLPAPVLDAPWANPADVLEVTHAA
jgi:hypothetical protein